MRLENALLGIIVILLLLKSLQKKRTLGLQAKTIESAVVEIRMLVQTVVALVKS